MSPTPVVAIYSGSFNEDVILHFYGIAAFTHATTSVTSQLAYRSSRDSAVS